MRREVGGPSNLLSVIERKFSFFELQIDNLGFVVQSVMETSANPNKYRLRPKPADFPHIQGVWAALTFMQFKANSVDAITVKDLYDIQAEQFRLSFHSWAEEIIGAAYSDPDPYWRGYVKTFNVLWNDHQFIRGYAFGFMRVFGDAAGLLPEPGQTKKFALFLLGQEPTKK